MIETPSFFSHAYNVSEDPEIRLHEVKTVRLVGIQDQALQLEALCGARETSASFSFFRHPSSYKASDRCPECLRLHGEMIEAAFPSRTEAKQAIDRLVEDATAIKMFGGAKMTLTGSASDVTGDEVREGMRLLKRSFTAWREPPVELPADHVIELVVRTIIEAARTPKLPVKDQRPTPIQVHTICVRCNTRYIIGERHGCIGAP